MSSKTSERSGSKQAGSGDQSTRRQQQEHDQDSDPPRTAVPPGSPTMPAEMPLSKDPTHDQDSDPPRTAVPPK